jgi:cell division septation protein DedD
MPSDQGPSDPRRPDRGAPGRDDWDADDGLGPVHEQRPASDYYDDDPYDDYDDGPRLLARRLVQGGVAILAVGLFLGVVWYAYSWGSRTATTGEVPLVAAPEGEEKVEPEDPGGMEVPHQDKLLLNQEGSGEDGQVERLLPPPEEPRPPEPSASEPAPDARSAQDAQPDRSGAPGGGTGTGDGERVADLPETTVPDQDMPEGDRQPDASAGETDGEKAAADAEPQSGGTANADPRSDGAADAETARADATPRRTPGRKPGGDAEAAQTPTGEAAPARQAADTAPTAGTAADGRYAVQIAAFQSEQAARDAWSTYRERFPEILGGQRLLLQNAEVDGQLYWRVRTGPFADRAAAQALCDRLKARDQSCLPVTR